MNKKGFEFSFGWLFAILVGSVIIFLAIYAAVRLISTERTVLDTETAQQLSTILTPIETGTELSRTVAPINFPSETRIYNNCTTDGNFGEQTIAVATSSGIGRKWQEPGINVKSYNKYIFSPEMMQGKQFYIFSKPFSMPFKVANVLFMWTDEYCFVNPTNEITDELTSLNLTRINITISLNNCNKNSKKVCFYTEEPACDIMVNPTLKSVLWRGKQPVFYEGSLIYGAIFAEPEVYECQVKRLMKRTSELAFLYNSKSEIISAKTGGCSSNLQEDLTSFATTSSGINNSRQLNDLYFNAELLKNENEQITTCRLWED